MREYGTDKIRKTILGEATIAFAIATAVYTLINIILSPSHAQDLRMTRLESNMEYIKGNELKHIEEKLTENHEDIKAIRISIFAVQEQLLKQYEVSSDNNNLIRAHINKGG